MPIYGYADETVFDIDYDKAEKALGCGILICNSPITNIVVEEALAKLKQDPELDHKMDWATLGNKFFHASSDSKNAHSHFCRAINKHLRNIGFGYARSPTCKNSTLKN